MTFSENLFWSPEVTWPKCPLVRCCSTPASCLGKSIRIALTLAAMNDLGQASRIGGHQEATHRTYACPRVHQCCWEAFNNGLRRMGIMQQGTSWRCLVQSWSRLEGRRAPITWLLPPLRGQHIDSKPRWRWKGSTTPRNWSFLLNKCKFNRGPWVLSQGLVTLSNDSAQQRDRVGNEC